MPHTDDLELGKFDQFSDWAPRSIDTAHAWGHRGKAFIVGGIFGPLATGIATDILIQTVNVMHTKFNVAAAGDCEIHIFEGTTFSAAGAPLIKFNRNRNSSIVSDSLISSAPTITVDGTPFPVGFLPGGSGGNASGGQSVGFDNELVLAPATNYLLRVITRAVNIYIAPHIEWYEPAAAVP